MCTRVERHIAMQPLELGTVLSRAAWHPEMADWAIMWETVLNFRRRWVEYYLSKIQNDSRMMREEICSPKAVVVRQYTTRELKILGGYDSEEDKLMPRFSLSSDDKIDM